MLDIWHFRGKFDVAKAGTLGKYFVDGDLFSLASHPGYPPQGQEGDAAAGQRGLD